jgi:glycosyltransferase involved in cell wall biosynthesis
MLTNLDISNENNLGVFNKMFGQARAFATYGVYVSFIYSELHTFILYNLISNVKIKIRPRSTKDYYNRILRLIDDDKYDAIYIRYSLSDYFFISFLDGLKKLRRRIKIVIDFPTYPYEKELNNNEILDVDRYFRKHIYKFIDFGICYYDVNSIFSVPVFNIGNGINLNNLPLKKTWDLDKRRLDIIAVANLSVWHGYDRLIKGLNEYYSEKHDLLVHFNIVGVGPELSNLKCIAQRLNLENHITFHGIRKGKELDELFDNSQVAIGSLGMYRTGLIPVLFICAEAVIRGKFTVMSCRLTAL